MAIAVNIGALVLVIAMCWVGVRWLAGRVHGRRGLPGRARRGIDDTGQPCRECDGVGAVHHFGKIQPCPVCEGTGVERAPF